MPKRTFTMVIERDEDGWLVGEIPELDGCYTQAKTMDELLKRIKEAIRLCLESSEKTPSPTQFIGVQVVEV